MCAFPAELMSMRLVRAPSFQGIPQVRPGISRFPVSRPLMRRRIDQVRRARSHEPFHPQFINSREKTNLVLRALFFGKTPEIGREQRRILSDAQLQWLRNLVEFDVQGYVLDFMEEHWIFQVYSESWIRALAQEIQKLPVDPRREGLEIAAGDGALTRGLQEQGISIVACDDQSGTELSPWAKEVLVDHAEDLLQTMEPEWVLASWLNSSDDLEQAVIHTPSVRFFIVNGIEGGEIRGSGIWGESNWTCQPLPGVTQYSFSRMDYERLYEAKFYEEPIDPKEKMPKGRAFLFTRNKD